MLRRVRQSETSKQSGGLYIFECLDDKVSNQVDHGTVLSLMDPKPVDFRERQFELVVALEIDGELILRQTAFAILCTVLHQAKVVDHASLF